LQLLFGGERTELRVRATLPAIERLAAAGLLPEEEAASLSEHYRFFRAVEHRLQLMSDLPVRLLPDAPNEQRKLARRMGYPPEAADQFMPEYAARAEAVRRITGEIVDRLAGEQGDRADSPLRSIVLDLGDGPEGRAADEARLAAELERLGFLEPAAAVETVARLARGGPHGTLPMTTRRVFAELAEKLLPQAGASPDPEGALRVVEGLARRMGTYQPFYRTLLDQPDMRETLGVVAGTSPWVAEEITRRPELMDALTDPEFVRQPRAVEALLEEARRRRDAARGGTARRNALRRFKKRELLRIAARDLLREASPREIAAELAHLAGVCLRVGLEIAHETIFPERAGVPGGFAVIGMGRLGGEELHYSSDLDLLYLYDPRREAGVPLRHSDYETLAAELSGVMQQVMDEGRLYEIDLRLRPEGKSGLMLAHLDAARQYYGPGGRSQTWEKQSLIKARFVAGDEGLAESFLALIQPEVYPTDPPAERDAEVRAMKRRIESERVGSGSGPRGARTHSADVRRRHVKLGPGGLSDVEFLVQFLQLRHGGRHPALRVRNTWAALAALAAETIVPTADADALAGHYDFLTRLRQRLYLRSAGVATDVLPTDPLEQRRLARTMDLAGGEALLAEYARRTSEVRALFTRYLG
jgi:glutamate-ammonia-ligase adenylyltransferase